MIIPLHQQSNLFQSLHLVNHKTLPPHVAIAHVCICISIYIYTSILTWLMMLKLKRILHIPRRLILISYSGTWTFPVPVEFRAEMGHLVSLPVCS